MQLDDKLKAELRGELRAERYDMTLEGVYLPRNGINLNGQYFGRKNREPWRHEGDNLVVNEGLIFILGVALGTVTKASDFYLTLFTGSTAPAAGWTGANFASVASENDDPAEGYVGATRPKWVPGTVTTSIDNVASPVTMTFAATSQVTIKGAALLTASQRGGTSGKLISASAFSVARVFQDADEYELGYRINATV